MEYSVIEAEIIVETSKNSSKLLSKSDLGHRVKTEKNLNNK